MRMLVLPKGTSRNSAASPHASSSMGDAGGGAVMLDAGRKPQPRTTHPRTKIEKGKRPPSSKAKARDQPSLLRLSKVAVDGSTA
eukprot:5074381-Prymnesium_polylepis.1